MNESTLRIEAVKEEIALLRIAQEKGFSDISEILMENEFQSYIPVRTKERNLDFKEWCAIELVRTNIPHEFGMIRFFSKAMKKVIVEIPDNPVFFVLHVEQVRKI